LAAIRATETTRNTNALSRLTALFEKETDKPIRQAIISAMGAIKGPAASAFIGSLLHRAVEFPSLLPDAVAAAEKIGGREMVQALTNLVGSWNGVFVVRPIIEALGNLKAADAIPAVVKFADYPDAEIQKTALDSLGRIGGEKAVAALTPLLNATNVAVRREAITALGITKQKSALEPLLNCWHDSAVRSEGIIALAQRPDMAALDAYLDGLADKNSNVRDACRKALQSMQKQALSPLEERAAQGAIPTRTLAALQKVYEKDDLARLGPIFAKSGVDKSSDPVTYAAFGLKNKGEANHGRVIFSDLKGVACIKCHKAEGQGGDVGPDLNSVGAK
jgi:HEAT repeat protein